MNIGRRIREAREDLGMQAAVLARRVGVAPNTIYRIEVGSRAPSIELLEKIARELRTEPAELLQGPALAGKAEASPAGRPTIIDVALDAARRQIALEEKQAEPHDMLDQRHANEATRRLREEYGLGGDDAEALVEHMLKDAREEAGQRRAVRETSEA